MNKTFIIKNRDRKKLGEITYSRKKFRVNVASPGEKERLEELLDAYLKGIRDLGEVILDKPIKPDDPLFLNEVRNQLARRGYLLIEKKR